MTNDVQGYMNLLLDVKISDDRTGEDFGGAEKLPVVQGEHVPSKVEPVAPVSGVIPMTADIE